MHPYQSKTSQSTETMKTISVWLPIAYDFRKYNRLLQLDFDRGPGGSAHPCIYLEPDDTTADGLCLLGPSSSCVHLEMALTNEVSALQEKLSSSDHV